MKSRCSGGGGGNVMLAMLDSVGVREVVLVDVSSTLLGVLHTFDFSLTIFSKAGVQSSFMIFDVQPLTS